MSQLGQPAAKTAALVFDLTAAEFNALSAGGRKDLLHRPQAVFRYAGGLYTSNGSTLVRAEGVPVAAAIDTAGKLAGLKGPDGIDFLVVANTAPVNGDGRPDGTIYIQTT